MSAISILILIEKWWFSAVGAALRRDCGEAVAWDRDYNELQSSSTPKPSGSQATSRLHGLTPTPALIRYFLVNLLN